MLLLLSPAQCPFQAPHTLPSLFANTDPQSLLLGWDLPVRGPGGYGRASLPSELDFPEMPSALPSISIRAAQTEGQPDLSSPPTSTCPPPGLWLGPGRPGQGTAALLWMAEAVQRKGGRELGEALTQTIAG